MILAQFSPEQAGLRPEHQLAPPLYESVFCLPESNPCEVTRIYPDGAVYFLLGEGADKAWGYLTQMTDEGVQVLSMRLSEALCIPHEPPPSNPVMGSLTYHFQIGDKGRCLRFHGLDYGDFEILRDLPAVINSHLQPASTDH